MQIIQTSLCIVILFSAIMVAFSENPIDSILFLIVTFVTSGALLFLFNAEFFGLLLVIIYVGAIAVLFLFVIMMLNIKMNRDSSIINNIKDLMLSCFFILIMLAIAFVGIERIFFVSSDSLFFPETADAILFDSLTNIEVLGQVLYNYFVFGFLVAGLILLIALVGSIVLTLRFNRAPKKQLINRQLSRTDNFIAFFN